MNSDREQSTNETVQIFLQGLPLDVGNAAAFLKEHFEILDESPDEEGEPNTVRRRLVIKEPIEDEEQR